jgi:hypothetical protein
VKARREFAKKYGNWTDQDWKMVTFSDEKMFRTRPGSMVRCWRQKSDTKFTPKYVEQTVQKPVGVMVWVAINGQGRLILRRCPPKVKARDYQDILASALKFVKPRCICAAIAAKISPRSDVSCRNRLRGSFQQDGAPVHTARSTTKFMKEKGIRQFNGGKWPPNSPDMNPVEHVWPIVGRVLSGRVFPDREALWVALTDAFSRVTPEDILRLYNSMPRRLQALKRARGRHTRY